MYPEPRIEPTDLLQLNGKKHFNIKQFSIKQFNY